jgi:hypothetical protein
MKVRAKLHVAAVNVTGYQEENRLGQSHSQVILNPVYSQDPNSENHRFWSASPNGKLTLSTGWDPAANKPIPLDSEPYTPGRRFYVDMERVPEGKDAPGEGTVDLWNREGYVRLNERTEKISGQLGITIGRAGVQFELNIDNKDVHPEFDRLGAFYTFDIIPADQP